MNRRRLTALVAAALLIAISLPAAAVANSPNQRSFHRIDTSALGKIDPALVKQMLGGGSRTVSVIVQLDAQPVASETAAAHALGKELTKAEKATFRSQVRAGQNALKPDIAGAGGTVLKQYQDAINGMRVRIDLKGLAKLAALPGVIAIRSIPKSYPSNAVAVPYTGTPAAWGDYGFTGAGVKIAIIDTGIDYTHADFGGAGAAAFAANDPTIIEAGTFPTTKVAGGFDLVGDAYDADNPASVPVPDPDPIDCIDAGHGTHVAGTAAGYGVKADGSTYAGPYNAAVNFSSFKVGPGVAPQATLYAFRVFGCAGSTNVVVDAIDMAVAAGVDVINMSLGSDFGAPDSADAIAADNAALAGITVAISAGNAGPHPYIVGSPGTSMRSITVSALDAFQSIPLAKLVLPAPKPAQLATNMNGAPLPVTANLVALKATPTTLKLGCAAADYTGFNVTGKIVAVKRGVCGFVDKGAFAQAAGASGIVIVNRDDVPSGERPVFIGSNPEFFTIPMLGVAKDGQADIIASDGQSVTLAPNGSEPNPSYRQSADFTSMGPRSDDSALKPDVSAPGVNIVSALVGSGNNGTTFSGTSMASPYTAGVAALVIQAHPTWSPARVKAAIMNTATATGLITDYEPLLAGSGVVQPRRAVDTVGLATLPGGTSSLSFGYEAHGSSWSETKKVTITNTGSHRITYDLSAGFVDGSQGSVINVTPSTLGVNPGKSQTVDVRIRLSSAALAALPPQDAFADGAALNTIRGAILATPRTSGTGIYTLRVPFLLVPRGTSNIAPKGAPHKFQASGGIATSSVVLRNDQVHSGNADVYAWGESDAREGYPLTDIRATGAQSLPGAFGGLGETDRLLVFAVNTWGRWSSPSDVDVEVEIDTNKDGVTDFILVGVDGGLVFTGEPDGQPLSFLFDPDFNIVDVWSVVAPVNGSDYLLLTAASSLGEAVGATSFDYDTFVYPVFRDGPADSASGTGHFDPFAPAVSQGDFIPLARGESATLGLSVDLAAFAANPALGWLVATNDDPNGAPQADLIRVGRLPEH